MLNLVSGVLLSKIRTPTALVGLFLGPIIIFIPVAGTLSVEPLIRADFPIPETSIFSRLLGVLFFTGIGFSIFFMSTNGVALMISFVLISTWGLVAKN